ncbi:MAG: glycosyltransferase family 4 protein [Actinomycetes bacterium]|nr:glycosyltransferase family 4 protein [Actinomycetes bacterium]
MHVLLVAAANRTTGGGERHVADLMRGLSARGLNLSVAAPAGGDLEQLAADLHMQHFALPLDGLPTSAATRKLRAVIDQLQPDVVHAHGTRAAAFARRADPRAARRVVYTLHGIHLDKGGATSAAKLLLERRLRTRTAAFITVCRSDARRGGDLRILDREKTRVIHNGVEPVTEHELAQLDLRATAEREQLGITPDRLFFLHIGRASVPKDQMSLLHAFSKALIEGAIPDDAVLGLVVTAAPDDRSGQRILEQLRAYIAHAKLGDNVCWIPPRPDLASLYRAADAFVLPSRWEGLPYTVLEAANLACPVIATAVDGIPEAIDAPGGAGILVPAGDAAALARAFGQLASLPPSGRAQMGSRARERILTSFTLSRMIVDTLDVYRGVTATAADR